MTAIRATLKESGAGFIHLMEDEWKEAGTGLYVVVSVSASIALEVGKMSWRRESLPTLVFWPREFHGLYSPWGHKKSDTTEQLSLSLSFTAIQ